MFVEGVESAGVVFMPWFSFAAKMNNGCFVDYVIHIIQVVAGHFIIQIKAWVIIIPDFINLFDIHGI